jgi:hypothetical protein
MSESTNIDAARRAKLLLQQKYQNADWLRGIGIAPGAAGFTIRINVDPEIGPDPSEFPSECEGVPVEVLRTKGYGPR